MKASGGTFRDAALRFHDAHPWPKYSAGLRAHFAASRCGLLDAATFPGFPRRMQIACPMTPLGIQCVLGNLSASSDRPRPPTWTSKRTRVPDSGWGLIPRHAPPLPHPLAGPASNTSTSSPSRQVRPHISDSRFTCRRLSGPFPAPDLDSPDPCRAGRAARPALWPSLVRAYVANCIFLPYIKSTDLRCSTRALHRGLKGWAVRCQTASSLRGLLRFGCGKSRGAAVAVSHPHVIRAD
jgi:hypothetical protein